MSFISAEGGRAEPDRSVPAVPSASVAPRHSAVGCCSDQIATPQNSCWLMHRTANPVGISRCRCFTVRPCGEQAVRFSQSPNSSRTLVVLVSAVVNRWPRFCFSRRQRNYGTGRSLTQSVRPRLAMGAAKASLETCGLATGGGRAKGLGRGSGNLRTVVGFAKAAFPARFCRRPECEVSEESRDENPRRASPDPLRAAHAPAVSPGVIRSGEVRLGIAASRRMRQPLGRTAITPSKIQPGADVPEIALGTPDIRRA